MSRTSEFVALIRDLAETLEEVWSAVPQRDKAGLPFTSAKVETVLEQAMPFRKLRDK